MKARRGPCFRAGAHAAHLYAMKTVPAGSAVCPARRDFRLNQNRRVPYDTVKVWLPLPDAFVYLSLEADEQLQYSADAFIRMLVADGGAELNQYNTIASFRDGMLVQIMHASYPFGPEE